MTPKAILENILLTFWAFIAIWILSWIGCGLLNLVRRAPGPTLVGIGLFLVLFSTITFIRG